MSRTTSLLLALVITLAGCSSSASLSSTVDPGAPAASQLPGLAPTVSVAEAAALRDGGALMLDVREPSEWAEGHIPGAMLVPLGELQARLAEIDRTRSIVVVCRSGNRSALGRDILLDAGFPAVTSLDGGMIDWAAAGQPVEAGG